ncbi:MAG: hypothetical protein U1F30_08375 [Steroidobacteraceae bacterium]
MIPTIIVGAGGRMGGTLLALLPEFPALALHAAIVEPGSPLTGTAVAGAAGVRYGEDLAAALPGARLVIDFSHTGASAAHVQACAAARVPLLLGTTGAGAALEAVAAPAATRSALLIASNTSIGVAVLAELVRRAAAALPGPLRHRDRRGAPPPQDRRALGHRADAGRGGGGRTRTAAGGHSAV